MRLIYISLYKIVKCSTTSSLHGLLIPRKKHIHKLVTDKCQTVLQLVVVPTKKTTTWFSDCVLQSDILHRDLLIKTVTMKPTYLSKERVSLWWIPPPREPPFGHFCCSLRQKQTELQQCLNPLKTWCLTVLRHICGIGLTAWQSGAGTDSGGKRHMVPLSRGRAASSAVGLEPPRHLAERWECFTVRRCPVSTVKRPAGWLWKEGMHSCDAGDSAAILPKTAVWQPTKCWGQGTRIQSDIFHIKYLF